MKQYKRYFLSGVVSIACEVCALTICIAPILAPAKPAVGRLPATPWTLEPDADVSVTNLFASLRDELANIPVKLETDGEKYHETLVRLPEEYRPGFVRSLYVGFLKQGPESPFGFGKADDQPGAIVRNRRQWTRLHSDEEVAAGRLRNRMARAAFLSALQSSDGPFPESIQLGMFLAACSVWLDAGVMEGKDPGRRRAEDGIPSAEALLEWFAENEDFCESVRAEARTRLDRLAERAAPLPERLDPSPETGKPAAQDGQIVGKEAEP